MENILNKINPTCIAPQTNANNREIRNSSVDFYHSSTEDHYTISQSQSNTSQVFHHFENEVSGRSNETPQSIVCIVPILVFLFTLLMFWLYI